MITKIIKLTKGKETIVDENDFKTLSQYKWYFMSNGYAGKRNPITNSPITLHKFLLNPKKGQEIDHINNNKLDNTRKNLRVCTSSQNKINTPARQNNKTGFKGVHWDKNLNKYRARIKVNGKNLHLGQFKSPEEASAAYINACLKYYGEFTYIKNH